MFDAMSYLWDLCTVFFTVEVIYEPLFMGLILMPTIFYVVYLLIDLLDYSSWIRGYQFYDGFIFMIVFDKLWILLLSRKMKRTDLLEVISSPTLAKLGKNENVELSVICRLCCFLHVQPSQIMKYVSVYDLIRDDCVILE